MLETQENADLPKPWRYALIGLFAAIPFISLYAPRATALLPGIIGLVYSGYWFALNRRLPSVLRVHLLCVGGIVGLGALSTLWSISPEATIERSIKLAGILVPALLFMNIKNILPASTLPKLGLAFIGGIIVTCICGAIDAGANFPIYRVLQNIPDDVVRINSEWMNRGCVALVLGLFAVFTFTRIHKFKHQNALIGAGLSALCLLLYFCQSQSAQLALAFGLFALLVFPARFNVTHRLMTVIVAALMLSTPLIMHLLYITLFDNIDQASWLQNGYANERLEIWQALTEFALQSPLYGHGLNITRTVYDFNITGLYFKSQSVLHPHNFSLQIWVEYGLLGVVAAAAFFFTLFRGLNTIPPAARKAAWSVALCAMLIASTAFGMWQGWWIGYMAFLVGFVNLTDISAHKSEP